MTPRRLPKERPQLTRGSPVRLGNSAKITEVPTPKWINQTLFVLHTCANFWLLPVVVISCILTYAVRTLQSSDGSERATMWVSFLSESKTAVAVVGAFLSFALVFRTNICYSRWWEGRQLWGALIYAAIHTAQQGRSWICNKEKADRLCCIIITFAYACKAQLRGNSIHLEPEEGPKLIDRDIISKEELNTISLQKGWQPYYCLDVMRAVINQALVSEGDTNLVGEGMRNAAQLSLEESIRTLATSIGGLIRVKSTGLPVAYNSFLRAFVGIFILMACLAWAPGIGWYTPCVIGLIYTIINMILTLGDCLEDPFGTDLSDLPLDKFCAAIESQIHAISIRKRATNFDLAIGPKPKEDNSYHGRISCTSHTGTTISNSTSSEEDLKDDFEDDDDDDDDECFWDDHFMEGSSSYAIIKEGGLEAGYPEPIDVSHQNGRPSSHL